MKGIDNPGCDFFMNRFRFEYLRVVRYYKDQDADK